MSENIVESLRQRAVAAQEQQARLAAAAERKAQQHKVELAEQQRAEVAAYITGILPVEIGNIQDSANAAADRGETSATRESTVVHSTKRDGYRGHAIAADVIELEIAKTVGLQQALKEHLTEVGFTTGTFEKPVGYDEEVPDYGREFQKTGMLYGVTISWAE